MRKRWLVNLLLFLVVGGLIAVVWLQPSRRKPVATVPLTSLKPGAVRTISIKRPGHTPIRLMRTAGGAWRLTAPFKARADRFRAAAVADIAGATMEDHFAAPAKLAPYGLAAPAATLTLNGVTIEIGKHHPFEPLRYVLVGHTVALISAEGTRPQGLSVDSFLSTRLFSRAVHPTAFYLPTFKVVRKNGIWRLKPPNDKISNDRINSFVDKWRYARAFQVTRYHGSPVIGHVTIHYERQQKGHTHRGLLPIDILATKPELILLRPDENLEYHFPQGIGKRLLHIRP